MAFQLEDLIIDRIQTGYAEDSSGNLLYTLTQLSEASIEVTSESKEAKDKDGTLIKKFYTGKSGTFKATNAMLNLNVLSSGTGSPKAEATTANTITMPVLKEVAVGSAPVEIPGLVLNSVKVIGINASGAKVADYDKDASAGATKFAAAEVSGAMKVTPPTDTSENTPGLHKFLIIGERTVTSGVKIMNRADQFPTTVNLTLKCLAIEPCTPDVVRAVYINIPSFQVSPDVSVTLSTDATLDYSGDMQVAYCNEAGKILYQIYIPEED